MEKRPLPSVRYSLLTFLTITSIIVIGITVFDAALQMMLFISFVTAIPFVLKLGYSFIEVENFAYDMIRQVLQPAIILLAVGALIGSWILSGTVPTMIYYGLEVISPNYFLVTTVILCIAVSLATGTSWGTIGTAGVAMIGIGNGMDIPSGITAGAIICGAFFGDKMSPLSDSTNLAPAVSGAELFPHIKHMMWTTIPAIILTIIAFLFIGFRYGDKGVNTNQITSISKSIDELFHTGFITLVPAIIVLILLLLQKPAFTSIFIGALVGALVGIFYQGASISEALKVLYSGFSIETGNAFMDGLLNRGGVISMLDIVAIFIFALGLGGILSGSGILTSILGSFSSKIKTERGLIFTTVIVSYINNMVGATLSFALVMTGTLMKPLYKKFKLEPKNLSRVMEDVAALGGPIIPWNTSAVFAAATLGVSPMLYIPFCFISFLTPLFTLLYGVTGFTITKYDEDHVPEGYLEDTNEDAPKVVNFLNQ